MNKIIVAAVERELGDATDNLYRARAAFRGMNAVQMAAKYGYSDITRAELIAEYEERVANAEEALAEVKAKP